MSKRGTKILIGCILCTMIVALLFLIVFRFTQLSCELVSVDPVQLASSQLAAFSRTNTKPIRSHDETILMKISAYLEYNIQPDAGDAPGPALGPGRRTAAGHTGGPLTRTNPDLDWPNQARANLTTSPAVGNPMGTPSATSNINNSNKNSPTGRSPQGPQPSAPQMGLTSPQQAFNNSAEFPHNQSSHLDGGQPLGSGSPQQQHAKTEKRFLPLELKSIETRNIDGGQEHKYILNFNCTKINMILVHQDNRVYVRSMDLELRPTSRQETTCQVQLPPAGEFTVADSTQVPLRQIQAPGQFQSAAVGGNGQIQQGPASLMTGGGGFATNATMTNSSSISAGIKPNNASPPKVEYPHFAHYYCNKPLRYSCYHYNDKSGPSQSNGILLAELHINGIEFETSTSWHGKHKKVKSDFKSPRRECNI